MARPEKYNTYNEQDIHNIMTLYATSGNYAEVSKELNIPYDSVRSIVLRNIESDYFKELQNEKRNEFNIKASKIIDKAMKRLDKELDNQDKIPVNSLSTVIGTLHDKMNNISSDGKVLGTPSINIKVIDNSNLEKAMYQSEEDRSGKLE